MTAPTGFFIAFFGINIIIREGKVLIFPHNYSLESKVKLHKTIQVTTFLRIYSAMYVCTALYCTELYCTVRGEDQVKCSVLISLLRAFDSFISAEITALNHSIENTGGQSQHSHWERE